MLTDLESKKLVCLIVSGKSTYRDIKRFFPLDWPDRYLYITDEFRKGNVFVGQRPEKVGLIEFETVPDDYSRDYKFRDTDKFRLTIKGRNLYDKSIREDRLYLFAKMAAIASIIAALVTMMPLILPLIKH